ncbi:unnamed protein product [Notodromas monacha]|uniref:Uncharacterized protein n=1 Tax=Notodromas monacha TaxID=399045 RepID=A0A7R9C0Q4_9CRUS|nr:unnamed protein product [Notodromas monacha]CAG0923857.1 unnamed protein product [Notodromas monacha]
MKEQVWASFRSVEAQIYHSPYLKPWEKDSHRQDADQRMNEEIRRVSLPDDGIGVKVNWYWIGFILVGRKENLRRYVSKCILALFQMDISKKITPMFDSLFSFLPKTLSGEQRRLDKLWEKYWSECKDWSLLYPNMEAGLLPVEQFHSKDRAAMLAENFGILYKASR